MNDESLHFGVRLMHLHLIESNGHVDLLTVLRHCRTPPFLGHCYMESLPKRYNQKNCNDAR